MTIEIPCHRDTVTIKLPDTDNTSVSVISGKETTATPITRAAIDKALAQPIGTRPLSQLAQGKQSACIVISDITRPVPNGLLLPPILSQIEAAGIARESITILIATGMHRANRGAELIELVGEDIAASYNIVNHDCHAKGDLREVMQIEGNPIEINRHYLDADLKILTGLIEPHPFAGFSGGGKSILPGISSFNTMKFMHSFALVDHPDVATACIDENPFRWHINSICREVGVDLIANVILNHDKQPTSIFCGDVIAAFSAGCHAAEDQAIVKLGQPADLVITSSAGYPLDALFYQATKGLISAGQVVSKGGTIVMIAACSEGLGSDEYCNIVDSAQGSPQRFREIYSDPDNFVIDQWGAQVFFQTLEHAGQILLYSPNLTQDQLTPFGITLIDDLDATLDRLFAEHDRAYVIPQGPYVATVV